MSRPCRVGKKKALAVAGEGQGDVRGGTKTSPLDHKRRCVARGCRRMLDYIALFVELRYFPETGIWMRRASRRRPKGVRADSPRITRNGQQVYMEVNFGGKRYKSHRLAWFYMTGAWPVGLLDHKNCDSTDNKWTNLRPATPSQNKQNTKVRRDNLAGIKCVRQERSGRWGARIYHNGRSHWLGMFDTAEEARQAYERAALKAFGEFARAA